MVVLHVELENVKHGVLRDASNPFPLDRAQKVLLFFYKKIIKETEIDFSEGFYKKNYKRNRIFLNLNLKGFMNEIIVSIIFYFKFDG